MDIGCAADYLYGFTLTDIHHADMQVIGVRVIYAADDIANHDLRELAAGYLHAFHAVSGHYHAAHVFIRRNIYIDILSKPTYRC